MRSSITIGNYLYDCCRNTLPQRYLSSAEAVDIVEPYKEVTITPPFPVRVHDTHKESTLIYQLSSLLDSQEYKCSVFIINETKAVVFASLDNDTVVLFDFHVHAAVLELQSFWAKTAT